MALNLWDGPGVYSEDQRLLQRMKPMLQRVLIVDPQPMAAHVLSDLLRSSVRAQIWTAPTGRRGLEVAKGVDPQIVFVEMTGPDLDGCQFTKAMRRSPLACRKAPVVMVTSTATAAGILAARDSGVHEFLRKPFTIKDILRRLEAVTLRPRDWIEGISYVGPDRRRFNSGDYSGDRKRRSDLKATPDSERLIQAFKILKSAVAAIGRDPDQALRAMQAQADELLRLAVSASDAPLAEAAGGFQRLLAEAARPLIAEEIARAAAPLLALAPAEAMGETKAA
jgi:CheY-like chemotaxis protein